MMQVSKKPFTIIGMHASVENIMSLLDIRERRKMDNGISICHASSLNGQKMREVCAQLPAIETRRYLDQYFLLLPYDGECQQEIVDILFSEIAGGYEKTIDIERNINNIQNLLVILKPYISQGKINILDFGCGSGLSSILLNLSEVRLIGVDRCPAMRELSRERGVITATTEELGKAYLEYFDCSFASYVMHLVYSIEDLKLLWGALKPGGALVANFHKGIGQERIYSLFTILGANIKTVNSTLGSYDHGGYLIFEKKVNQ